MMKILHYVDAESISWQKAYIAHIKELEKLNLKNILMCRAGGGLEQLAGNNHIDCVTFRPLIASVPLLSPRFLKIINQVKPDIIHTRLSSAANIAGAWRRFLNVPVIATFDKPAKAKYYKNLDYFIACAGWLKDYMSQHEGLDADKISVIYNPVDIDFYSRDESKYKAARAKLNIQEHEIIFAGMGIYIHRKGFDVLIKAFAEACRKFNNLKLMLIGGEAEEKGRRSEYVNLARDLNILNKVLMPEDFLSDVREWLWAADVLVMPSRAEGFSIALLEGIASGLPVIASDIAPFTEIIKPNLTGLIAKNNDIQDFSDKMLNMLNLNSTQRKELAHNALQFINHNCTPEVIARQAANLYIKIAAV